MKIRKWQISRKIKALNIEIHFCLRSTSSIKNHTTIMHYKISSISSNTQPNIQLELDYASLKQALEIDKHS